MKEMTNITLDIPTLNCHICNTRYKRFSIGKKHVYATCEKCERRDEVGLVF